MIQEEKQLLLRDLCARLPYHTIVNYRGANVDLSLHVRSVRLENCKPYLRPMSSMTEEEKSEFYVTFDPTLEEPYYRAKASSFDWLNSHHFDYRGLIEKDLALKAPEGMYNLNKE